MATGKNWVDYKEIKSTVTMEMALKHYGLFESLKRSGHNLVGCCPIHKGTNPRQFSVNLDNNIFNCFGNCKSGGNILDFVAKMEGVQTRKAALLLNEWFLKEVSSKKGTEVTKKEERPDTEDIKASENERIINPPLTFELNLDPNHSFFKERGINQETVDHFGLGFCSKGIMKNRVAIPIHDENGSLVAYCGRAINDEQIKAEGKYKMPPKFVKSAVVYNLHRNREGEDLLILVESFLSVFKLHQAGFHNVVALMGSNVGEGQEKLIVDTMEGSPRRVILLFDADESGAACTSECMQRFGHHLFVKMVDISPYGKKPHHLTDEELITVLSI